MIVNNTQKYKKMYMSQPKILTISRNSTNSRDINLQTPQSKQSKKQKIHIENAIRLSEFVKNKITIFRKPILLEDDRSTLSTLNYKSKQATKNIKSKESLIKKIDNYLSSQKKEEKQQQFNFYTFFRQFRQNSLFFCSDCLTYLFAIQKQQHYPQCRNKLDYNRISSLDKWKLGKNKLQLIVSLSKYTNTQTKQVQNLYDKLIKSEIDLESHNRIIQKFNKFLVLSQILQAMHLIYEMLIKNNKPQSMIFLC